MAEDHVLIEAAGVGYAVFCAPATLAALPPAGEMASLYTDMVVREDLLQLFGFRSLGEREWHRLLTSVQGVGAKVSLAVLGVLGPAGLSRALAAGDAHAVRAVPGIGPKLATRIVTELKGKAPALVLRHEPGAGDVQRTHGAAGDAAKPAPSAGQESIGSPSAPEAQLAALGSTSALHEAAASSDALSALLNLGYDRGEAAAAVAEASAADPAADAPDLIKSALQSLGRTL